MSVLICYDGSASARHAVAVAAATVSGDDMTLMHAWCPPVAYLADAFSDPGMWGGPSLQKLEQLSEERAKEVADEGERIAREHGLTVALRVVRAEASVWRTILDVADELDAKLIVVGTRGLTAVQSALLGSVSGAIVHHSKRPVMVVPEQVVASGASHAGERLVAEAG
ncbi:MAG TPA: universal stress protein [Solirubrobacteraceae bacterium]|nr:universal stress protein [Solirubrobacteraceae bacterium]